LIVVLCAVTIAACAPEREAPNLEAERLVHLFDHLASDYGRAVSASPAGTGTGTGIVGAGTGVVGTGVVGTTGAATGLVGAGTVRDWNEYDEQLEAVEQADQLAARLAVARLVEPPGRRPQRDIATPASEVRALVEARAPEADVLRAATLAKERVIDAFPIERAPAEAPDRARGAAAFAELCSPCHGATGRADTTLAAELQPPPPNFHDPEVGGALTPARVASVLRFGLGETAMPAFPSLSDQERWSLAFTVVALRHQGALPPDAEPPSFFLEELSTRSDDELARELGARGVASERRSGHLAALRRDTPFRDDTARAAGAPDAARPILVALVAAVLAALWWLGGRDAFRGQDVLGGPEPLGAPGALRGRQALRGRARRSVTRLAIAAGITVVAVLAYRRSQRDDPPSSASGSASEPTSPSELPSSLTVRIRTPEAVARGTVRLVLDGEEHWARFGSDKLAIFPELPPSLRKRAARIEMVTEPELEPVWERTRLFALDRHVIELFARAERPLLGVVLLFRADGGEARTLHLERLNLGEETTIGVLVARAVAGARVTTPDVPPPSRFSVLSYRLGRWLRPSTTMDHLDASETVMILVDDPVRAQHGDASDFYFTEVRRLR